MNGLAEPLGAVLDRAHDSWRPIVESWRCSAAGQRLVEFVDRRREAGATVYPADVLRALALTPRHAVRVVILGQDPYHGPGQAEGLCFSVPADQRFPPSLRNIFKELQRDLGLPTPVSGHLGAWARQGVLLLNSTLTVESGDPGAHANKGWEALTSVIIADCAKNGNPKVFLLWGAHAQQNRPLLIDTPHCTLMSNHPSPLSAARGPVPFVGNGHFGKANRFLEAHGGRAIDWGLA